MGLTREEIVYKLWYARDPFHWFPRGVYETDLQGWGQNHRYLTEAIVPQDNLVVIEIGVWKGASTIMMASKMRELGIKGTVISVDTWLGSVEHFITPEWFDWLGHDHGWPNLYNKFANNVVLSGLQDYVVPLPLDSVNASEVLAAREIVADVIHLDAGHDYQSVITDLRSWWPRLRPGGLFIGDDYYDSGVDWPGVQKAFDEFFGVLNLTPFEYGEGKCRLRKPVE